MSDIKWNCLGFIKLCLGKASKDAVNFVSEKENCFISYGNNTILQVVKKQNVSVTYLSFDAFVQ